MPPVVKLGINCLVVAGLTLAGIFLFARLPRFTLAPLQWAGKNFDEPTALVFWFVYTVLVWAVLGAVVAWAMLLLEPRKVALYGLASAVTFSAAWPRSARIDSMTSPTAPVAPTTAIFMLLLMIDFQFTD